MELAGINWDYKVNSLVLNDKFYRYIEDWVGRLKKFMRYVWVTPKVILIKKYLIFKSKKTTKIWKKKLFIKPDIDININVMNVMWIVNIDGNYSVIMLKPNISNRKRNDDGLAEL